MDFITHFPITSRQNDVIMVVIEKMRKVAHFVAIKSTNSTSEVDKIFIKDIVRLHGVPKKIISKRC